MKLPKNSKTYLVGAAMGLADLVPGVSGGTIAFISGIYEELIETISSFDLKVLKLLFRGKLGSAWKHIHGTFLISLFAGVLTSILVGASIIHRLLLTHPALIQSFFVGLVISCSIFLLIRYMHNTPKFAFLLMLGTIIGYVLTGMVGVSLPQTMIGYFFAGVLGSMAMLLPGISGSYILLIVGMYESILGHIDIVSSSLKTGEISGVSSSLMTLGMVGIGVICGIIGMSKILKWLLSKRHDSIITILTGCMLGALPAVLPSATLLSTQYIGSLISLCAGAGVIWLFFRMSKNI